MNKIVYTTLLILFTSTNTHAQPGWLYKVQGNLNDIDSIQIRDCLDMDNMCYFGSITIDSTTDLSRLNHLNTASNLLLDLSFEHLPKEFSEVELPNVKSLFISCARLNDLSNLPLMENLEDLTISGYNGDTLNFLNKLPNLIMLTINYSSNIVSVGSVFTINSLVSFSVRDCKNIILNDIPPNSIKYLHLINRKSAQYHWEDLVYFPNLEVVTLVNFRFEFIPNNFPKKIKKITITKGQTNLETLNQLYEFEGIEELNLNEINMIWKK